MHGRRDRSNIRGIRTPSWHRDPSGGERLRRPGGVCFPCEWRTPPHRQNMIGNRHLLAGPPSEPPAISEAFLSGLYHKVPDRAYLITFTDLIGGLEVLSAQDYQGHFN
jgi:hypothetical protein